MAKKSDATHQSHTEIHVDNQTHTQATAGSVDNDQVAELTADLQRLQAEFINYKRRVETERTDAADFMKARIIREFLAVRDSFDQEQVHRPTTVDPTWAQSIDAIRTQFDQVLAGLGAERFTSLGQPFDPHFHQAVAVADDGTGDHEIVAEELQPGYKLGSVILRHAMVKVGHTAEPPAPAAPSEPTPEPAADQPQP